LSIAKPISYFVYVKRIEKKMSNNMPEYRFDRSNTDNIPAELKEKPIWILWAWVENHQKNKGQGGWDKVPQSVHGGPGSTTDPSTWGTFDQALARYDAGRDTYAGLGIVIRDDLIGIDVDFTYGSEDAREVIDHFPETYTERSPSGKLHILTYGTLPEGYRKKGKYDNRYELYDYTSPRYLTITGIVEDGAPTQVVNQQAGIDWYIREKMNGAGNLVDEIIATIHLCDARTAELFDGIIPEGKSESERDYYLLAQLTHYTTDRDMLIALFSKSGCYRDKTDSKRGGSTYIEKTLDKVLSAVELDKIDDKEWLGAKSFARECALQFDCNSSVVTHKVKSFIKDQIFKDKADIIALDACNYVSQLAPGKRVKHNGIPRTVVDGRTLYNMFAPLRVKGKATMYVKCDDNRLLNKDEVRDLLSQYIIVVGFDQKGRPIYKEGYEYWYKSADKKLKTSIEFTCKAVAESVYNLFCGYGVVATAGDCKLIKDHILNVICDGDVNVYEQMLNLISWQLQNIGVCSRLIVTLVSEQQQVGKGLFLEKILMPCFGSCGKKAERDKSVTGSFNSALAGAAYLFADEVFFAGDRKSADYLKSLSATDRFRLEEKYLKEIELPNAINMWFASNKPNPVHVEEKDARYWILRVNEEQRSKEYFDKLLSHIDSGGLSAFLYEMLNRDVGNFKPRDIDLDTVGHRECVIASLNPGDVQNWLAECVTNNVLLNVHTITTSADNGVTIPGQTGIDWYDSKTPIQSSLLHKGYREWVKNVKVHGVKETSPGDFWKTLTDCGFEKTIGKTCNSRKIPSPQYVARKLNEKLPGLIDETHISGPSLRIVSNE